MGHRTRCTILMLMLLCGRSRTFADSEVICAGDCDYDGSATVDELVRGVGIALDEQPVDMCLGLDLNRDATVTIDELIEGVHNAAAGCPKARFVAETCHDLPVGQDPSRTRCGAVIVPEVRGSRDGRTLRVAVVVLETTGSDPAADPVLFLGGGPGDPVLDGLLQTATPAFVAPLQTSRDLVFIDQRGAGRSVPSLMCPEWQQAFVSNFATPQTIDEDGAHITQAMRACHDRLASAGINFGAYNSRAIVADIDDLMKVLGYRQWNLYGFSYGTRVALTALRDASTLPRSVVLDSSLALQANGIASSPANHERTLNTLFAACENDASCAAVYPDLRETFFATVDELNTTPLVVHPTDSEGNPFTVVVTGDRLLLGITAALSNEELIPFLPAVIYGAARGNRALLTTVAGMLVGGPNLVAWGMQNSVVCAEEIPFNTAEVIAAANAGVREAIRRVDNGFSGNPGLAICDFWGLPAPAPIETEPVHSDVPAAIFGGEFDSIEPFGRLAAETLPHSFYFLFPGQGHGQLAAHYDPQTPSCAVRMMAEFLDDPNRSPDASCLLTLPSPHFLGT